MIRIRWSHSAFADLQAISSYIEGDRDLATANYVCRVIYDSIQILRHYPESGKPGIEDGTREFVIPEFPNYIVAYELIRMDAVHVLRIWHGAQQRRG